MHGSSIPSASKVHLLYGSANRDPREFGPTADDLDVGRQFRRMLSFGNGPHHCIGAAAARLRAWWSWRNCSGRYPSSRWTRRAADWRLGPSSGAINRCPSPPVDRRPGRRRSGGRALVESPRCTAVSEQIEERPGREGLRTERAPTPDQAPDAMSSRARTGLMAVCQTTAWEPYSDMHQSLSTTW